MKILLTGGAGFIGSNFILSALSKGHQIINVDKLTYAGNLKNLDSIENDPNYVFCKQDICNRCELENIFAAYQPDAVVHMAAESHVDRSIDHSDEFIRTNILGTHVLLECAFNDWAQKGKPDNFRFLHLSTDEVFGALGDTGTFSEVSPYRPNSPYSASKAGSDLIVRSYFKTYGFPALIANSSNNYGPRQYPEKLIPLTILNALQLKSLPVYGRGAQIRDWLYVEDHVRALLQILENGTLGESYCIGGSQELTNLEVVQKICTILDELSPSKESYVKLIQFVQDRPGHDFRYAIDASKVSKSFNWRPEVNFNDGLEQTIKWYLGEFLNNSLDTHTGKRIGLRT